MHGRRFHCRHFHVYVFQPVALCILDSYGPKRPPGYNVSHVGVRSYPPMCLHEAKNERAHVSMPSEWFFHVRSSCCIIIPVHPDPPAFASSSFSSIYTGLVYTIPCGCHWHHLQVGLLTTTTNLKPMPLKREVGHHWMVQSRRKLGLTTAGILAVLQPMHVIPVLHTYMQPPLVSMFLSSVSSCTIVS